MHFFLLIKEIKYIFLYTKIAIRVNSSAGKRHGADGTATAAGAAVYDFDANWHRRSDRKIRLHTIK